MKTSPITHTRLAAAVAAVLLLGSASAPLNAQQPPARPPASAPPALPPPAKMSDAERRCRERLAPIKLERLQFEQAAFDEVLAYLRAKLKELDRAGTAASVNFVIKGPPAGTPITCDLRNIPMIDAVRMCSDLAGYKMRFEDTGITFTAAPPPKVGAADPAILLELEQSVAEMEAELQELQKTMGTSPTVEDRYKAARVVFSEMLARYYRAKYGLPADGSTPAPKPPAGPLEKR